MQLIELFAWVITNVILAVFLTVILMKIFDD